jgi:hypothetical protein
MSGLRGYPFHPEGEAALADVLLKTCQDEERARSIVALFDDVCPSPRDLRFMAADLGGLDAPPAGCFTCMDPTGPDSWYPFVVMGNGAKRCSCKRGLWLAARDVENLKNRPQLRDSYQGESHFQKFKTVSD